MTTAQKSMDKRLRGSSAWSFGKALREADEGGARGFVVFTDVAILGLESSAVDEGNNRTYLEAAVKAAAPIYEGCRVFLSHCWPEERGNRDIREMMGQLKGVRWDAATKKLRGDLHMLQSHATAHTIQILENMPDKVSLSHDVQGMQNDDGCVCSIVRVWSVDLVPHGGTNTNLFESEGSEDAPTITPNALADLMKDGAVLVRAGGRTLRLAENDTEGMEVPEDMTTEKDLKEAKDGKAEAEQRASAAEANAKLAWAFQESDLPKESVAKLRPLLEGKDAATIATAIAAEQKQLKDLSEAAAAGAGSGVILAGEEGAEGGKPQAAPAKPTATEDLQECENMVLGAVGLLDDGGAN